MKKYLFFVPILLMLFFAAPVATRAEYLSGSSTIQTSSTTSSLISQLLRQVYALQKQLMILIKDRQSSRIGKPVACTMEAKICPDGVTYVGRQGPKCEFAPCPTSTSTIISTASTCKGRDEAKCHPGTTTQGMWINQNNPANWPTYNDKQHKYQINFPAYSNNKTFVEDGSLVREFDLIVGDNKTNIYIAFPKSESCGRYGPGVASKKINDTIGLDGKNYQVSGWVEDPLNYAEWYRNNPQYGDPSIKDYSKTINLCDVAGKFSITYTFEVKNANSESPKVKEVDLLIKNVLKTFKFTESI